MRRRGNLLALAASVMLSFLFVESFLRVFPYVALSASQRRELAWRKEHKTAEQILTTLDGKRAPRIVNPQVWPVFAKRFERAMGFAPAAVLT